MKNVSKIAIMALETIASDNCVALLFVHAFEKHSAVKNDILTRKAYVCALEVMANRSKDFIENGYALMIINVIRKISLHWKSIYKDSRWKILADALANAEKSCDPPADGKRDVYGEEWYTAEVCGDPCIYRRGDWENCIAMVYNGDTDEAWDRASLMAAAPRMFNALESALEFLQDGMEMGWIAVRDRKVIKSIEAAIKEAKGK